MTMPCKLADNHAAPVRFYDIGISAGFPSPAKDYEEPHLHLNDLLIKNPNTAFLAKASGDSMIGAGINDGDTLVVDRGLTNYKDKRSSSPASTVSSPSNATRLREVVRC